MNAAKATLGGIPLTNAEPVGWEETYGTTPYTRTFVVHESEASALDQIMGKPVTLSISSDSAPTLTWSNIYPLRRMPTRMPFHVAVVCADVRYKWAREIVIRTYNLPRKTGSKRIVNGQVIELAQVVDEWQYVAATLDGGTKKWTPRRACEDVFGELAQKCGHEFKIESFPVGDGLAIEGAELHHNGDSAAATALAHMPGADVKINSAGVAVIVDATDRKATADAFKALPPTVAGGVSAFIDQKHVRPSKITVWFDREVELRFDSVEEGDDPSPTVEADPFQRAMLMENVVPLPDPVTEIDGESYGQGTYVPFRKALAAWNADITSIGKPKTPPALTVENVRKYWWRLEAVYGPLGTLTPSAAQANWTTRVAAIRTHFRRTYQISHSWMKHIRDLRPYRLGILDPVTGARAASQAWSQYCIEPTSKAYGIASLQNDPTLQFCWLNVDNYPGFDADLNDKPPSPAVVHVVDRDLGVLHIDYRLDPFGMRSTIHPSMMKENGDGKDSAPTRDLRDQVKGWMAVDGYVTGAPRSYLSADFRVAVVVTAMPIGPNNEERMFPVEVDPGSVGANIAGKIQVDGGKGPAWHIACPPTLMTAWYALLDTADARESAPKMFGLESGVPQPSDNGVVGGSGGAAPANPGVDAAGESLAGQGGDAVGYEIINLGDSFSTLKALAQALAVAQWAAFVDSVEGSVSGHLAPSIALLGMLDSVRHTLDSDGRLLTTLSAGPARRPIDPLALLPKAVRPIILRIPEQHG